MNQTIERASSLPECEAAFPVYIATESMRGHRAHNELAHWHQGVEIIRVLEGKLRCSVNGRERMLGENHFCFINRGQIHHVAEDGGGLYQVLIIDPALLTRHAAMDEQYIRPVLEDPEFPHLQLDENDPAVRDIFALMDELAALKRERPLGYGLEVVAAVHRLFSRLYRVYCAKRGTERAHDPDVALMRRLSAFIYDHFAEELTLDAIAAAGDISRSKCTKLFHEYAGQSPIQFLNSYRLETGRSLLTEGKTPVGDIALSCGFGQQSYFNRLFLRAYGCTPLEYRKRAAG